MTTVATKPKGRRPNSKRLQAVRAEAAAARSEPLLNVSPIEAAQEALDILVSDLRYAQSQCDKLDVEEQWRDTMVGRIPHEWIRYRDEKAYAVAKVAQSMVTTGIAERAVRVEEARAAMMIVMIKRAAERAGLTQAQVRRLGSSLRDIAAESSEEAVA